VKKKYFLLADISSRVWSSDISRKNLLFTFLKLTNCQPEAYEQTSDLARDQTHHGLKLKNNYKKI
jgi:hypothetical protein